MPRDVLIPVLGCGDVRKAAEWLCRAFGERHYGARDDSGRPWVFTRSIADLAPEDWGAAAGPTG